MNNGPGRGGEGQVTHLHGAPRGVHEPLHQRPHAEHSPQLRRRTQSGEGLSRGGCPSRGYALANYNHGDSITSRLEPPPPPPCLHSMARTFSQPLEVVAWAPWPRPLRLNIS
jgi:hypothetical protein